jgi:pyruvate dehydrogenase (quinone)
MTASLSGGLASIGAAVLYAIAAKFARPDRPVVGLVGDVAMQMNNMAELITAAKYWKSWSDPRFTICVLNNEDLNRVTWEQRAMEGDAKFRRLAAHSRCPLSPFRRVDRTEGDRPEDVGPAWDEAPAAERPWYWKFKTDQEVPPIPPHLTLEQVRHLTAALMKGDPQQSGVVKGTARQLLNAILPGRGN